ncbi:disease resistance protein RPV1 isoform X2 [Gossypium hirsutum]|uniref:Disease resistance protein RPV1 isoform X2 n=1 Tax=Gossypium hirsutum TaxID=3635 RepID=A0ABM2YZL1_GOSHI|nr:disease resistance protein RPV1-like isoform X2 [Gossypium hirsutum]
MLSLPSSFSSISRKTYDVFLSFRGEDTRKNFTDHLYEALMGKGVHTFRDDPKLEAGEEISPELFKVIQQSRCSIIIFSETYAFSSWCLEELAEIVKQKNEKRHQVFPIFYKVDPSDLRKQKGKVEEAFVAHEERYKEDKSKIQKWRNALTQVANIKGWHLNNRYLEILETCSLLLFLEVKFQNGSTIREWGFQSRYHWLTIFGMIVNGWELLCAALLSLLILPGRSILRVKFFCMIKIMDKLSLINLFLRIMLPFLLRKVLTST